MSYNYKVAGLRIEKYVGDRVEGHNCDFEYFPEVKERFVLLLSSGWRKIELSLWETEGECGSGWCCASFGEYDWKEVNTFAEKNYTPVKNITLKIEEEDFINLGCEDSIINSVFTYSPDGGDSYYPSGHVSVDMGKFKPVGVICNKRPVHIFYGGSDLCKSHIASLVGKSVFETDSVDTLPDVITSDIVVLGNRNKGWSLEDIKPLIFEPESAKIISVEFKE